MAEQIITNPGGANSGQALNSANSVALKLQNLMKSFQTGAKQIDVLRGVNLAIRSGEIVSLIGPSGSGKSTLLQIAGLLEVPSSGTLEINSQRVQLLDDYSRTLMRRHSIGFVYQFHHLLREFSALENVMIPQRVAGVSFTDARKRARDLLARVGLQNRFDHRPARLSGGEQQRVAIARGLANRPNLLLADEPTGNLDPETAETVFKLLLSITREEGMAALIATHNLDLGSRMDRIVRLENGAIHES
ncbi:MAG: ABC transporter ATP-binding protein [Alphaproteobacteria bacterium]